MTTDDQHTDERERRKRADDGSPISDDERREIDELLELWAWVAAKRAKFWRLIDAAKARGDDAAALEAQCSHFERELLTHTQRKAPPYALRARWSVYATPGDVRKREGLVRAARQLKEYCEIDPDGLYLGREPSVGEACDWSWSHRDEPAVERQAHELLFGVLAALGTVFDADEAEGVVSSATSARLAHALWSALLPANRDKALSEPAGSGIARQVDAILAQLLSVDPRHVRRIRTESEKVGE